MTQKKNNPNTNIIPLILTPNFPHTSLNTPIPLQKSYSIPPPHSHLLSLTNITISITLITNLLTLPKPPDHIILLNKTLFNLNHP